MSARKEGHAADCIVLTLAAFATGVTSTRFVQVLIHTTGLHAPILGFALNTLGREQET